MRTALAALLLLTALASPAAARESPRYGGELIFVVPAEPPSYDAHREETFAIVHPAAPHYSTLLRVDPDDRTATRLVGDLAESWSVSFVFVEYVRGSHWLGRRNPDYWDKGKPYLDGYRAVFIADTAAQVAAIRGQRAMIQFRGFSPGNRDSLVRALGDKIAVQESPWACWNPLALNHERKPFDDRRVRRALTLALDRYAGAQALSKITLLREITGVQGEGSPFAASPAELEPLAGYGRDIARSRAEARRLLREAGVPDGFAFTFKNRGIANPYEALGVWLVDQWRQIGLRVRMETLELGILYSDIRAGSFEVAADFHCSYLVEPDLALFKFQSMDVSPVNYGRYVDRVLDELYQKQSRATDRKERRRAIREFERRLLHDETHFIYTFQWHRIVPHSARVRGWTITPSHFLNSQLDTVWLAE